MTSRASSVTSNTATSPVMPEDTLTSPSFVPVTQGPRDPGAATSVLHTPSGPTIPLTKLAPEAALRRLELAVVRRLEGFLHGDHLGLLPGPGSDTNDARCGACSM